MQGGGVLGRLGTGSRSWKNETLLFASNKFAQMAWCVRRIDSGIALAETKPYKANQANCSVLSHPIDSAIGAWDIIIAIFREQVWYPSTTVFKCEGAQMCGVRDAFLNDSGGAVLYGGFLYRLCCSHDVTMPFWVLAWFKHQASKIAGSNSGPKEGKTPGAGGFFFSLMR